MVVPYVNFDLQYEDERKDMIMAFEDVMIHGNFILGHQVEEFEKEFAKYVGCNHAIGVANGTDSLILALRALGIGPGAEVITAPNSWISSASAIALVGAKPVFVDVGEDQNIDPNRIESAVTRRTRAIMPVHLTGRTCRMSEINYLAKRFGLDVIEDAAQSVGSMNGFHKAGASGRVGSFSLHPLKNLNASGDAGIITTSDDDLAKKLRLLRNHGLKDREHVVQWGYNSRLDTLQAAMLLPRLNKLYDINHRRRQIARRYSQGLKSYVNVPLEYAEEFHVYHVYVIQTPKRDALKAHLEKEGIETKIHYPIPIHLQECAKDLGYQPGSFPNCERQAKEILSLPINQYLTTEQVDYVIHSIREFF